MRTIRNGVFGTESGISLSIDFEKICEEYYSFRNSDSYYDDATNFFSKKSVEIEKKWLEKPIKAVVLSVDIRNSTFLMEHTNSFASFIFELILAFKKIVLIHKGIFDKFTGDGFICYFPEEYSGENYLLNALKTALACHNAYKIIFEKNKEKFDLVMNENGLGIGIDVGDISIEYFKDEIAIIGKPVVNACRLNSAPANNTYLNNKAYFAIKEKYPLLNLQKVENFEYKHIGNIGIYKINFDDFPMIYNE